MRIESDWVLDFPRERVFSAYRDELPALVEYLPNVRDIEVRRREAHGDVVELQNVWHAGGEIPKAVRHVLREGMLSWDDYATWDASAWECRWHIEPHSFREAVRCGGTNRFVALDGGRTRLEIRGDLAIDLSRVKGVPSFVAGSLGRTVEQFMVKQYLTNLTSISEGLARYLEATASAG